MPWHRENKAEQGLDGPCHNQTQFFPILGKGWGGGGGGRHHHIADMSRHCLLVWQLISHPVTEDILPSAPEHPTISTKIHYTFSLGTCVNPIQHYLYV